MRGAVEITLPSFFFDSVQLGFTKHYDPGFNMKLAKGKTHMVKKCFSAISLSLIVGVMNCFCPFQARMSELVKTHSHNRRKERIIAYVCISLSFTQDDFF